MIMATVTTSFATGQRTSAYAPVLLVQGFYYLVTGVWPLVSIETFMMVTGPKTDLWLVRTVGVLIAVIAASLLASACRRVTTPETVVLAVGAALALTAVDVIYVSLGTIDKVYLLDAAAELALVAWWLGTRPRATPATRL
jgi:hypothetical protein